MAPQWRVGLAGVGRGAGYGKLFADDPRCEITAVCDISPEALERFSKELKLPDSRLFTEYGEFVTSGLDIVFVGTPMPVHAEQTIAALEAGCHVLSEVTAATTVEDCGRIVETVRRTGRTYMLAENCIYWHFVQEWKALVHAGRLGEIIYAEAEYLHPIPELIYDRSTGEKKWRFNRAPLHYCTHSLGPILDITGDRVVRVCGRGQGHRILPEAPIGGIDVQVALLETNRGMLIKLLRSSVMPRKPPIHFYALHGTRGYVETDRGGPVGPGRLYIEGEMDRDREIPVPLSDPSLPPSARAGGHGTAEYCLVQDFLGALERGEKPRIDEVRAMDMTVPGLIAHESAMRNGAWLDVPCFA
ncbi:MAG: Gfo/Idh/MocA family protein [Candidatus Zipacnadales bacterium]